jgi:hypothetical protein
MDEREVMTWLQCSKHALENYEPKGIYNSIKQAFSSTCFLITLEQSEEKNAMAANIVGIVTLQCYAQT